MLTVGIDPGLSGYFALLDADAWRLDLLPMPLLREGKQKNGSPGKSRVDIRGVLNLVAAYKMLDPALLVLERMEGRAHASAGLSLGRSAAIVECAATFHSLALAMPRPIEWKTYYRLLRLGKGGSRARAAELFPAYAHEFARDCDDGKAEASLLAHYGLHLLRDSSVSR